MTELSRRTFLTVSGTASLSGRMLAAQELNEPMLAGPSSGRFQPVPLKGNRTLAELESSGLSAKAALSFDQAPRGAVNCWGIPFQIESAVFLETAPVVEDVDALKAQWLVFMHATDIKELEWNADGFASEKCGYGRLGEHVADYVVVYSDGSQQVLPIRRRHQINMCQKVWGENCFQAVPHLKPHPIAPRQANSWGVGQTRTAAGDTGRWLNWLWAWENPWPEKSIVRIRFEPMGDRLVLFSLSAGSATSNPLRWEPRLKAVLKMSSGTFDYSLKSNGELLQIQLDMGQVISAQPRKVYPNQNWAETTVGDVPKLSGDEVHIEYAAHRDARFHLSSGEVIEVSHLLGRQAAGSMQPVAPARRRVKLRVFEKGSGRIVPVRLHVHGESGEYLQPKDHHRYPTTGWFETYGAELPLSGLHYSAYISGETDIDLPLGKIYVEISKGFEIRPVRQVLEVKAETEQFDLTIEKVLPWRERGWVTADTHVHFLSPPSAQLEGSAEGVNVINLLASQWGEMMTNVGDFDGKTTFGSREAGGDGEYLVRVGSENRNHILGHISLIGYEGSLITPMCTGGADEAAIGDPLEVLLTEWAEQCRAQGGMTVLPHFPGPRAENAMAIIEGKIDGVEFTSLGAAHWGIDPYSLSDYYRYLNCGYFVPIVGGTDKMGSSRPVGRVRTYARIPDGVEFTYDSWKRAICAGRTFVSYGPLMEFSVEGQPSGSRIDMKRGGGTVDVCWNVASVVLPMSRVELIVNGEIRESRSIGETEGHGAWSVRLDRSSWVALLVRGRHLAARPEGIVAHSSPVMLRVEGSEFFAAADAVTILDQIEGSLAYLDTVSTRAQTAVYKRMRLRLTSAYRDLHNRLHKAGQYHRHTAMTDHPEHH